MTDDLSARLALPFLHAGQAQKETTHNEALALLDIAVQAAVSGSGVDVPPPSPANGQCWIVGAAPTGAWAGHARAIAGWTEAGWRFVPARAGMAAWDVAARHWVVHDGNGWEAGALRGQRVILDGLQVLGRREAAIAAPTGGTTIDTEARVTVNAILTALRTHGMIAG